MIMNLLSLSSPLSSFLESSLLPLWCEIFINIVMPYAIKKNPLEKPSGLKRLTPKGFSLYWVQHLEL